MIPLRRAFDENRRLVIPAAAGLALNVLLYAIVVYPLAARVHNTELREQAAERELAAAQRDDQAARGKGRQRDHRDGRDRTAC